MHDIAYMWRFADWTFHIALDCSRTLWFGESEANIDVFNKPVPRRNKLARPSRIGALLLSGWCTPYGPLHFLALPANRVQKN